MIFVKLVREEGSKSTRELLHLDPYTAHGTRDKILVSQSSYGSAGFILTESDFEQLYWKKKAQSDKEKEAERTKEESEQQKELAELGAWKAEMNGKNFIQQIFALWNMRKRQ